MTTNLNYLKQAQWFKRFTYEPLQTYLNLRHEVGDRVSFSWPISSTLMFNREDVKELLEVNKHKIEKGSQTQFLRSLIGNSLPVSEGKYWRKQRRIIQKSFHHSTFKTTIPELINKLQTDIQDWDIDKKINLSEKISKLTFDISFFYFFGNVTNSLKEELFSELKVATGILFTKMKAIPMPYWVPTPNHIKLFKAKRKIDTILSRIIEEKRVNTLDDSLISRLLEDKNGLTIEEIRNEVLALIVAGHDTTSNSIIWAMYHILKDDSIKLDLLKEVKNIELTYDNLDQLNYIESIFKETIRMYPPLHLIARVATEDISIGGQKYRKGTNFVISQFAIQRDERYFDSPLIFNPKRFTDLERKDSFNGSFIPFSLGARRCIGEDLSYNIVKIIIHTLFRTHQFKSCNIELSPVHEIILRPDKDLLI